MWHYQLCSRSGNHNASHTYDNDVEDASAPENRCGHSPQFGFRGDNSGHRSVSIYQYSQTSMCEIAHQWRRTYFIWKSLVLSYDETWFAYPLWIAAAVEVDLAVICACAPAIRPFLLRYLWPLIASKSGSRSNQSYNKGDGYVSTRSGPSSRNPSNAEATFDEKISAADIIRDGKTPTVKLSLAKTPQEGRLKIMQRVSWEVDYEDQSKLRQHGGLDLHDNEYDIGAAMSSASEEERQLRGERKRPQSVDIIEATKRYEVFPPPRLQTNPLPAWTELEKSQSRGTSGSPTATRDSETFWRSDTESDQESTQCNHPPEAEGGERRWTIERNPFRDRQQVVPTSPARVYKGSRAIEMGAFGQSRSPPRKAR